MTWMLNINRLFPTSASSRIKHVSIVIIFISVPRPRIANLDIAKSGTNFIYDD